MTPSNTTLIKGGIVVIGQSVFQQDVLISGEKITAVGDLSSIMNIDNKIDASGLLVLPGAVDTHVHFNDVFMNTISVHDYYTGTLAAAYGGVTSVIDFCNQLPGEPLVDTLKYKDEEARGKALVDWGVHPVITQPTPETLDQIPLVVSKGAPTIKCYLTYRDEGLMIEHEDLRAILAGLRDADGMLLLHAEHNSMLEQNIPTMIESGRTRPIYHAKSRPRVVEDTAIQDAIKLVEEIGGRVFIVHTATDKGVELAAQARARGLDIVVETCTHYLIFTEDMLKRDDGIKWICSPPLRNQTVQNNLWKGIQDGRIAMVTSDDAAYSWDAKLYGKDRFDKCPNGIPGVEVRFSLLYSEGVAKGRISLPRFVELVCTMPALLFGLTPQKGSLIPGADADIVIFDPNKKWIMAQKTLHQATDWSAYENIEITGKIEKVFSRGELIIDGDDCLAAKGRGRYLHRKLNFRDSGFGVRGL